MKITVCIGSSCHLKGSREIVESFESLIEKHNVSDKVELAGTFCLGRCVEGVCVKIDDYIYSLKPDEVSAFFKSQVLAKL